jgi:hypothetical protein
MAMLFVTRLVNESEEEKVASDYESKQPPLEAKMSLSFKRRKLEFMDIQTLCQSY